MKIQEQRFEEPWNLSRGETSPVFDIKSIKEQLQEVSDLMKSDNESEVVYAQKRAKILQDSINDIKANFKEFDFYWKTRYKAFEKFMEQVKDFDFIKLNESVKSEEKAFTCPKCGNKTLYCTEHSVKSNADVDYHEEFVCDECGTVSYSEPQYDGRIEFIPFEQLNLDEGIVKCTEEDNDLNPMDTQYNLENTDDDIDGFEWELVKTKSIPDSDGFTTDYSLYKKTDGTKWITIYGDIDINPPEEMYADMKFNNEKEAEDFFLTYKGFVEDDEDLHIDDEDFH